MCMGVDKKVSKKSTVYWQQKEGYVLNFSLHHVIDPRFGRGGGVTDHSHSMKFVHSKLIISACVFLHQFVQNVLESKLCAYLLPRFDKAASFLRIGLYSTETPGWTLLPLIGLWHHAPITAIKYLFFVMKHQVEKWRSKYSQGLHGFDTQTRLSRNAC